MKFPWSNLGNARLNNDEELCIHSCICLVGFLSVLSVIVYTVNLTEENVISLVFQSWNRGTLLVMEHLLISYNQWHSMDLVWEMMSCATYLGF